MFWDLIFIFLAFPPAGSCSQAVQVPQHAAWILGSEIEGLRHNFICIFSLQNNPMNKGWTNGFSASDELIDNNDGPSLHIHSKAIKILV